MLRQTHAGKLILTK
ncbi:TPA: hemin uptake protein HemP [Klebsiella pneumoniae]|nr:hemin uptake protein HemP [Klebsiella pneumoniae]